MCRSQLLPVDPALPRAFPDADRGLITNSPATGQKVTMITTGVIVSLSVYLFDGQLVNA